MYWVKYPENKYKFIAEDDIKENWPLLAIDFLEKRLEVVTNKTEVVGQMRKFQSFITFYL